MSSENIYYCKTVIHDPMYKSWSFMDRDSLCEITITDIHPAKHKLFDQDVFMYDSESKKITLQDSSVRTCKSFAGILILERNKTYGRTKNKKRLLYKCIPDDKRLPAFLIPYAPTIGFSKMQKNKYVTFKFDHWDDQHPHGGLVGVLGEVDQLEIFYEYQLYCKHLHISFTPFINATREKLALFSEEEYVKMILENPAFAIEDRRHITNIFSIDPENSIDIDDAFSIRTNEDNTFSFTVYIANVFLWIETLGLWNSFSDRISTIYFPDRKNNMLPHILSDDLCSLLENKNRFAFAMDITMNANGDIENVSYHNVLISVSKNYRYEEHDLLRDSDYHTLLNITRALDKSIADSHDVVSYWMIKMNSICGEFMSSKQIGIFRHSHQKQSENILEEIPNLNSSSQRMIRLWQNISCKYVLYDPNIDLSHDAMNIKQYIHITSPIRRIVDVLNQIWFICTMNVEISADAQNFLEHWRYRMDYINTSMRSIRKIQTECELLHHCYMNPHVLTTNHRGVIFDKWNKSDGMFEYMVYLEDLKLLSRMKTPIEFDNYSMGDFKVYLFEDEYSLKKKVRIQYIDI